VDSTSLGSRNADKISRWIAPFRLQPAQEYPHGSSIHRLYHIENGEEGSAESYEKSYNGAPKATRRFFVKRVASCLGAIAKDPTGWICHYASVCRLDRGRYQTLLTVTQSSTAFIGEEIILQPSMIRLPRK
jgi:hypothetical protein